MGFKYLFGQVTVLVFSYNFLILCNSLGGCVCKSQEPLYRQPAAVKK